MLVNDGLYYLYIVAIYKQVSMLLDHLGITQEKRETDCKTFYIIGGALFIVAISSLVISLANKSIANYIGPFIVGFGFLGIWMLSVFYRECYDHFIKRRDTFYKKVALILVIVLYLFVNKNSLNEANNRIHKTCSHEQSIK